MLITQMLNDMNIQCILFNEKIGYKHIIILIYVPGRNLNQNINGRSWRIEIIKFSLWYFYIFCIEYTNEKIQRKISKGEISCCSLRKQINIIFKLFWCIKSSQITILNPLEVACYCY